MGQQTPPRRTVKRKPPPKMKRVRFWIPPEVVAAVQQIMDESGLPEDVVLNRVLERGVTLMESMPPETLQRYLAGTMPPEEIRRYLKRSNGKREESR